MLISPYTKSNHQFSDNVTAFYRSQKKENTKKNNLSYQPNKSKKLTASKQEHKNHGLFP